MARATLDIIAIGEPLVEFNQTRPGEPEHRMGFGGDSSNCAIAAARQGARVGYWTALGADRFGDAFLELWRREGIDASRVPRRRDAPTGIYFVTHDEQGHHFSYYREGSAASRMRPDELPEDWLAAARLLHVSGIGQAISTSACDTLFRAVEIVRAAGGLISYDPNYRPRLWPLPRARAIVEATAAVTDILLPGLDDARALTGLEDPDAICDHWLSRGARIVALTLGAAGCVVATSGLRLRLPGHPVAAVDATGAGDTFDGAFIAEYLRTGDVARAAAYANAAAALATTGFGAVEPIPHRAAVERFLAAAQSA